MGRSPKILRMMLDSANNKESANLAYVRKMYTKIVPALHRRIPLAIFNAISSLHNKFKVNIVAGNMQSRLKEAHRSCAMASNNFMLSMFASRYDTCPMMGIDAPRMKNMLNLGRGAEINMVIAIGKRSDERSVHGRRRRLDAKNVCISI